MDHGSHGSGADIASGKVPGKTGGNSQEIGKAIPVKTVDAGAMHKQIPMKIVDEDAGLNDQYNPYTDGKGKPDVPFMGGSKHSTP